MPMKSYVMLCVLAALSLAAAGCGERKKAAPAEPAAAVTSVAPTNNTAPEVIGPKHPAYAKKTDADRQAMREKHYKIAMQPIEQAIQETVTNLLAVTSQMHEVEVAARSNHTEIGAAYDAMNRARDAYADQIAALPDMKPLRARIHELRNTYDKLAERKQAAEKEMKTP